MTLIENCVDAITNPKNMIKYGNVVLYVDEPYVEGFVSSTPTETPDYSSIVLNIDMLDEAMSTFYILSMLLPYETCSCFYKINTHKFTIDIDNKWFNIEHSYQYDLGYMKRESLFTKIYEGDDLDMAIEKVAKHAWKMD